jgi:hypothetical protein
VGYGRRLRNQKVLILDWYDRITGIWSSDSVGVNATVRIGELCMVEHVERLYPELELVPFGDLRVLEKKSHIPIVDTGAAEEPSPGPGKQTRLLSRWERHRWTGEPAVAW